MALKNEEIPTNFEEALTATGHLAAPQTKSDKSAGLIMRVQDFVPYVFTRNGRYNIALAFICALILLAIGCDLFGFSLVVTAACDLDLTISQKGVMASLPFIGILLVSYFWGYVSDTRGRRFTLVVSLPLGFILSCISSLSPNWIIMAVGKFFAVCFSCAPNSATYTLVGESCPQRVRSKYMLLMTCMLLLSPGGAAVLAYPTLKMDFAAYIPVLNIVFTPWRLLLIILALPSGILAVVIYFFYESPKFLINSGRTDECLMVLKSIHAINNRNAKEEYKIKSIKLNENMGQGKKEMNFGRMLWEQSAPLFRPPMLKKTAQLFYIVAVVYMTNNSFLVWLPHVMNLLRTSLLNNDGDVPGNLCDLIVPKETFNTSNFNSTVLSTKPVCRSVDDNTAWTLIGSSVVFSFLNLVISHLPNRRKAVLIGTLTISAISGICINLMPEPISSVFFFMMFTITCLGMGILASYFVDLFPTSYRGMVACLSIMVGRTGTFVGINLVGNILFKHCEATFYIWSIFVLTSIIAAWYLPPDKPPQKKESTNL